MSSVRIRKQCSNCLESLGGTAAIFRRSNSGLNLCGKCASNVSRHELVLQYGWNANCPICFEGSTFLYTLCSTKDDERKIGHTFCDRCLENLNIRQKSNSTEFYIPRKVLCPICRAEIVMATKAVSVLIILEDDERKKRTITEKRSGKDSIKAVLKVKLSYREMMVKVILKSGSKVWVPLKELEGRLKKRAMLKFETRYGV
ncbi:hypothetical protein B0I35DRAFT_445010 [Stachybotrys elegans]|uniref:RING-type domain-containing protein n=1 Tax=Stachybotrys elegans TaxID=80388 RepID=A0A8K0WJX7_9HYPO|nr:hypothetical protein B0I35DRAFT_445010 [Stachybotrys elegans]